MYFSEKILCFCLKLNYVCILQEKEDTLDEEVPDNEEAEESDKGVTKVVEDGAFTITSTVGK